MARGNGSRHTILQAQQHQPRAPLQSWDRLSRLATYFQSDIGSDIYKSILLSANQLSQAQLNPVEFKKEKKKLKKKKKIKDG